MPDPVTGTIAATTIGGAVIGAKGADKASDAASKGSAASIAEQARQFDVMLGLTAPQRDVGNQALNTLASAFVPGYSGMNTSGGGFSSNPFARTDTKPGGGGSSFNGLMGISPVGGLLGFGSKKKPSFNPYTTGSIPAGMTIPKPGQNRFWSPTDAEWTQYLSAVATDPNHVVDGPRGINNFLRGYVTRTANTLAQAGQAAQGRLAPVTADQLSTQFRNLPGTQFQLNEMNRNIGGSFAARGGALGGNALRALADRTSAFASDRIFNQLNMLAGYGAQASGQAAQGALQTGANIGNTLYQQGSDRASGIAAGYGAIGGGLNSLGNNLLLNQYLKKVP